MSTALLYHAWGGRGYRLAATRFENGRVCFHIEYLQNPHTPLRCAHCGSTRTEKAGKVPRSFRTLPVGSRPVILHLPIQRLRCFECGRTAQVRLGFADPRRGYTRAFERYVLELSRFMTVQDVARHLQVSWDIVRDIQKRHLLRRFSRPKLKHLKHIAIDELSIGKGHRYLTVVLDLDSGAVVFVGQGKGADSLDPFFKRLRATAPLPFVFWFHNYLGTRNGEHKSESSEYLFPLESGIEHLNWSVHGGADRWFDEPSRGWTAVVDEQARAGLALVMDGADVRSFHTWGARGRDGLPTLSWHLRSLDLPDGGSYRTTVRLIPFSGLKTLDGVGPSIVGQLDVTHNTGNEGWSILAKLASAKRQDVHAVLRRRLLPNGGWQIMAEADLALPADGLERVPGDVSSLQRGTHLLSLLVRQDGQDVLELERAVVVGTPSARYVLSSKGLSGNRSESQVRTNFTSMEYETPHVKWARPYAYGKTRALILIDGRYQREVIELAQRMDLEFDSTYLFPRYVFEAMSDYYGRATERDLALGLERLLRENPDWEVLVMAGHMFRYFTPEQRRSVFEKIREGAGLVVVAPDATYPLSEISPLQPTGVMRPEPGAWQSARDHFITSVIPWEALPGQADVYRYRLLPESRVLASVGDDPLLAARTVGKGRVVAMSYCAGDRSETPDSPGQFQGLTPFMTAADGTDYVPPPTFGYHEYYFSLLAKAVLWAAGKEPDLRIQRIEAQADRIRIRVENTRGARAVDTDGAVTDKYGNTVAKVERSRHEVAAGLSQIDLPLRVILPGGRNIVDVFARTEGGAILDWGSASVEVKHPTRIAEVRSDRAFYRLEQDVHLDVRVAPEPADGCSLRTSVRDGFDRLIAQQVAHAAGGSNAVSLKLPRPLNRLLSIKVELLKGRDVLDLYELHRAVEFPFRTNTHSGELILQGWHNLSVYGLNAYLTEPFIGWMEDAGFNSAYVVRPDATQALRESLWRHNMSLQVRGPDMRLLPPRVTGDPAHPQRVPCVSDPAFVQSAAQSEAVTAIGSRPGVYSIQAADEVSYGTGDEPEVCFSPHCMDAMRKWLKSEYPSLDALNREWGTRFADWQEVRPLTRAEVEARGDRNYSSWCDHRSFGEMAVAHFYREVASAVSRSKSGARYGPSGNPEPGTDSGYDYWQLRDAFTALNAYVGYDELALWAGDTMEILKYGQFDDPDTTRQNICFHLMHGIQGTAVCGTQRLPEFDWTDSRAGQGYRLSYAPLRRGIGRLMVESQRTPDPIALHYSRNASRIADVLNHASLWREMRWSLRSYLDSCGFDHGWISYEQLERGQTAGLKVIYLPMSCTLSDGEARALEQFVSDGGTLIGELAVGIADGHGRMLKRGRLDHVFGIRREDSQVLMRRDRACRVENPFSLEFPRIAISYIETGLSRGDGHVLASAEEHRVPLAFAHSFGKGLAIYLACDLDSAFDSLNSARGIGSNAAEAGEAERFMKALAERAGCAPRLRITGRDGQAVPFVKASMFRQGDIRYFWLLRNYQLARSFAADPAEATIDFGASAFVREVFADADYGRTSRVSTLLAPNSLMLYSVVPYDVTGIAIAPDGPIDVAAGQALSFQVNLSAAAKMSAHTLRLDVLEPDGTISRAYSCNLTARDGRASFDLPLALDDKPGRWRLVVKDLTSGKAAERSFLLR